MSKQTFHVYMVRGKARWYSAILAEDKDAAREHFEAQGYTVDRVRHAPAPPRMGRR